MGDWQQYLQSVLIGLLFSYLLAKLISVVVSFKDDNLSLSRRDAVSDEAQLPPPSSAAAHGEADSMVAEHGSVRNDDGDSDRDDDDDGDWEGVESTELDEAFSAATAFVAAAASEKGKVPTATQLQLYGLYKIATEGPCRTSQPSPLKVTARAKWQAWQKLGVMPPEDAMQKYIDIVTELYPTWAAGSSVKSRGGVDDGSGGDRHSADQKGPMGPVFSSLVMEDESADDTIMDAVHGFAREGELDNLLRCIDSGVSVNLRDTQGQTPLHWAVDRGHLDLVEVLVGKNADVNAMDNEGQTPLHYAAVCEREAIAEFLVNHSADADMRDNEGMTARDICSLDWPSLRPVASNTD